MFDPYTVTEFQLGYCPTCFAAVPTLKQREHGQYHADRGEAAGELLKLPTTSEVLDAASKEKQT
jgi:hypothetical protein